MRITNLHFSMTGSRSATRSFLQRCTFCCVLGIANLLFMTLPVARAQNGIVLNQTFAFGAGSIHTFMIASLPASSPLTYDHLHLLASLNTGDGSSQTSYIDATFGNRNGFRSLWTLRGAPVAVQSKIVAYRDTDGSVDIYLVLGNQYVSAGYSILEAEDGAVYSNPPDLGDNDFTGGTLVFDSSSGAYPPALYTDFNGNTFTQGNLSLGGPNLNFSDGTTQSTAYPGANGSLTVAPVSGNIGIGTASPQSKLSIVSATPGSETGEHIFNMDPTGFSVLRLGTDSIAASGSALHQFNSGWAGDATSAYPPLGTNLTAYESGGLTIATNNTTASMRFFTAGTASGNERMRLTSTGDLGVGTTSPSARLEVNGNVKISGSGAFLTFPDGTEQSTAYLGAAACPVGGDYAESVDVTGEKNVYEPGDVMAVDPSNPGHFLKSSTPYSTLVAGIYSTKPGFVGRRQTTDSKTSTSEIPMAMVGIVPTKVTAENGPISIGDLLVTSSIPGYVMKGTDRGAMTGAVVGKALKGLDSGTGVIEVLVSLQ